MLGKFNMNNKIIKFLHSYSEDTNKLNSLIVSSFVKYNNINIKKNKLIKKYTESFVDEKVVDEFLEIYKRNCNDFNFENLIELFEICIPKKEKIVNGAVYTPKIVKDFVVENSIKKLTIPINEAFFCDLSCGCGGFLITIAREIHLKTNKPFKEIYSENIYGVDVSDYSVERSEILLSLFSVVNGEDVEEFEFNLLLGNSLSFNFLDVFSEVRQRGGFDCIVGNPPYVRAKNISKETKDLLSKWQVTKTGNPDLYIPFFEIGLTNLKKEGILGYITVNTFMRGLNARSLRSYFSKNKFDIEIYDFGSEQVFKKKSTYTCICFISNNKNEQVKYIKIPTSKLNEFPNNFVKLDYSSLDDNKWIFNDENVTENIKKIDSCAKSIGDLYKIKNGLATLANNIYIFKPVGENEKCYLHRLKSKEYWIEKEVCRDIIKPNILKYEFEIERIKEKIIFPYINTNGKGVNGSICGGNLKIIEENYFKEAYPGAYHYLLDFKDKLDQRDKGKGNYGSWYAFGRTQALNEKGKKLLFPYIDKEPHFVYTNDEDLLIYCGYAIYSDNEKSLIVLKKILESDIFWHYIKHTSKPYSAGYYSFAKNYVKTFGLCDLDEEEIDFLEKTTDRKVIQEFLSKKYGIIEKLTK